MAAESLLSSFLNLKKDPRVILSQLFFLVSLSKSCAGMASHSLNQFSMMMMPFFVVALVLGPEDFGDFVTWGFFWLWITFLLVTTYLVSPTFQSGIEIIRFTLWAMTTVAQCESARSTWLELYQTFWVIGVVSTIASFFRPWIWKMIIFALVWYNDVINRLSPGAPIPDTPRVAFLLCATLLAAPVTEIWEIFPGRSLSSFVKSSVRKKWCKVATRCNLFFSPAVRVTCRIFTYLREKVAMSVTRKQTEEDLADKRRAEEAMACLLREEETATKKKKRKKKKTGSHMSTIRVSNAADEDKEGVSSGTYKGGGRQRSRDDQQPVQTKPHVQQHKLLLPTASNEFQKLAHPRKPKLHDFAQKREYGAVSRCHEQFNGEINDEEVKDQQHIRKKNIKEKEGEPSATIAAFDDAVLAVLLAAGFAGAQGIAEAMYKKKIDIAALENLDSDGLRIFGIYEDAAVQNLRDVLPSINSKLAEAAPNMHKGEQDARDEVVKIIAGSSLSLAPTELCCPITHELYTDPVNASDGETYERSAIERWIKGKTEIVEAAKKEIEETKGESERALRTVASGIVSPMGHGTLKSLALTPARAMKRMADDWRRDFEME